MENIDSTDIHGIHGNPLDLWKIHSFPAGPFLVHSVPTPWHLKLQFPEPKSKNTFNKYIRDHLGGFTVPARAPDEAMSEWTQDFGRTTEKTSSATRMTKKTKVVGSVSLPLGAKLSTCTLTEVSSSGACSVAHAAGYIEHLPIKAVQMLGDNAAECTYKLGDVIGNGTFATVFRGTSQQGDFAIKVLKQRPDGWIVTLGCRKRWI